MTEVELITFDNNSRKSDLKSSNLAKRSLSHKESLDKGKKLSEYFDRSNRHPEISKRLKMINSINSLGKTMAQDTYDDKKYGKAQMELAFNTRINEVPNHLGINTKNFIKKEPVEDFSKYIKDERVNNVLRASTPVKINKDTNDKKLERENNKIESFKTSEVTKVPTNIANAKLVSKAYENNIGR